NQNGVMRIDHPESDHPAFTRYTTANGLSSDLVISLAEDNSGRIYIGTGSGVDRLDVATGRIRKYTSADGLAPGEVNIAFRDHNGSLWFGSSAGLSRLISPPDRPITAPPVVITSLRVRGVRQQTSELGETEISGLRYQPNQNDMEIGFVALSFAPGDTLRYQYTLEGADSGWSPPSPQRTVNYANVPPGLDALVVSIVDSGGHSGGYLQIASLPGYAPHGT
ncbi:MAG TPA: two-component regulator propeller domain-containing protein, partial [Bryobacteraceae bacterium]|nr:two-component regulator propeller domain-containing protein [Bryobacteraceae bacterium]